MFSLVIRLNRPMLPASARDPPGGPARGISAVRHPVTVGQSRRPLDHHALAGREASQHLGIAAIRNAGW